ncbi:hypothetical protein [Bacillus sp. USDA818B3_A]|uniref:hypothetical protein n=1 Tax=Bacillus sp. USDA818B3_A TaxID=2698834 RepID=UPI00136FD37A|nr:hypothetical protein [Bacillus sp. USDA818B3_A]
MKTIIQSLIVSFVIHFLYLAVTLITGYIRTKNYKPDIANRWEKVKPLQSEVAFGTAGTPLFFLFTFIGVALICGLIIISYGKIRRLKP